MEREGMAVFAAAWFGRFALIHTTVAVTPPPHHIKALKSKAGRINFAVATRATDVGAVFVELLANRDRASYIGFDGGYRRRGRDFKSQNALHHPLAAQHGRGRRSIRGYLKHAGLREKASTWAVGRQPNPAHGNPLNIRDAVMIRQALVDKNKVCVHDIVNGQVLADVFFKG